MRTKYFALACGLLVVGTALAVGLGTSSLWAVDNATTTESATSMSDNCCSTGNCCCPGQGSCCDPTLRTKAVTSAVEYVKKARAGCCSTGNCCCPGQGSCCATAAAAHEGRPCCAK